MVRKILFAHFFVRDAEGLIPVEVKAGSAKSKTLKNLIEIIWKYITMDVSWYYPETRAVTIYSQDGDTYEYQRKAEATLRDIFALKTPVSVSYKSNDAILCQFASLCRLQG